MLRGSRLRTRLLIAFFGISTFSVLAAGAALYTFVQIGKVLEEIATEHTPATLAALELSREVERIVSAAPALLSAATTEQQHQESVRIAAQVQRVRALLDELKRGGVEPATSNDIESTVAQLGSHLDALYGLVAEKLVVEEQNNTRRRTLAETHARTQRLLAPWIRVQDQRIAALERAGEPADPAALVTALLLRKSLEEAQDYASAVYELLLEVASSDQATQLPALVFRAQSANAALERVTASFEPRLRATLHKQVEQLAGLLDGIDSMPAARQRTLEMEVDIRRYLQDSDTLSHDLTVVVDQLVENTKKKITQTSSEGLATQRRSALILMIVVALSLLSSTVVGVHLSRNLIERLSALSDSMQAIAGGDLEAPIPASGNDEIGAMADALTVFRDTAIEAEEANVREIQQARNRLTDAIESITEGFSLYDKEDRLVLCNSKYTDGFYPALTSVMEAGTPFETIVRTAARQGLKNGWKNGWRNGYNATETRARLL